MKEGEAPEQLTERARYERRMFGAIGLVGVAALFFGFFQILNTIRSPFHTNTNQQAAEGQTSELITKLTQQDTDGDGLNDFEELYVYNTSPYLTDSDSDGSSDQEEVLAGADPNCAAGQTCSPLALTNSVTTNSTNSGNENTNLTTNTVSKSGTLSPAELRQALLNAGAPQATLDQLDDATLLQLYQEVIGAQPTTNSSSNSTAANTNTSSSGNVALPSDISLSTLQDLSSDQIRQFLSLGGADSATLNQLDDATLRSIFQEALGELNTNTSP